MATLPPALWTFLAFATKLHSPPLATNTAPPETTLRSVLQAFTGSANTMVKLETGWKVLAPKCACVVKNGLPGNHEMRASAVRHWDGKGPAKASPQVILCTSQRIPSSALLEGICGPCFTCPGWQLQLSDYLWYLFFYTCFGVQFSCDSEKKQACKNGQKKWTQNQIK